MIRRPSLLRQFRATVCLVACLTPAVRCFADAPAHVQASLPGNPFTPADSATVRLLPREGEVAPWKKAGDPLVFNGEELFEYINGGAEIYYEYGFARTVTQDYVRDSDYLTVDIYEMSSPAAAFGIYSVQRQADDPPLPFSEESSLFDYHATFWKDRYCVTITGVLATEEAHRTLNAFAEAIARNIDGQGARPGILDLLPEANRVARSEGYLSGYLGLNTVLYLDQRNVLEIDGTNAEAAFAAYARDNQTARLLLVRYDDLDKAENKYNFLPDIFSSRYERISDNSSLFKDNRDRYYGIDYFENIIVIIFRSSSKEIVTKLFSVAENQIAH